jgi:adenylate cyclase
MICSACGHKSEPSAKFCSECGARLLLGCPVCGVPVKDEAKFCSECGAALQPATPSSPETIAASGEKKHITVLFADVAGSMDLQERLDAEVWAQIMGRFVSILAEGVRRFGGTVDKFTGDGIMVLFGAPVAQEDHARRACHAAWHLTKAIEGYSDGLREEHGVELDVRLGLNSGEVVVGRVGDDVMLDPTALGHTVGLAQRMEAMAEPGHVYLTYYTARLVEGWFRLDELGARTVKGVSGPLRVFVLGRPVSSPVRQAVGVAPLVGRERELAVLEDALTMAMDGYAQLVGVVGEAGVGKSRLCEEFADSCRSRGVTVRRAAGVSHGRDVPLLPILAFYRDYFGIGDADDPPTARHKVSERLLALDPGLNDALPLLFDFLEVPDPAQPVPPLAPEVRMRRMFDLVRRITARRSERETLVLIFEDLHWFDPQSEAFLERLVDSYPGSRTLVVTNFRPEFSAPWMRHSYYRQLPVTPLREQAIGVLLGGLLGVDLSLAPLVSFVSDSTGGNPFFVEEVLRGLIEDGTLAGGSGNYRLTRPLNEIRVPPSVQAVLAARIDRLPPGQKAVLETAAVIGRTFDTAVLERVTGSPPDRLDEALAALCAAELLQDRLSDGTGSLRFWHPLTQEVAYGSLLSDHRRSLHRATAEALVDIDPARRDERAALIASHFERSGDLGQAAHWTFRAAAWAVRTDFNEAIRRWRRTIEQLAAVPATDETRVLGTMARARLLQIGARRGISKEEASRLVAEGQALSRDLDDLSPFIAVTRFHTSVQLNHGDLTEALAAAVDVTRLGEKTGDAGLMAALWLAPAIFMTWTGPIDEGLVAADRVFELSGGDPDRGAAHLGYSPLTLGGIARTRLLAYMGRLTEAAEELERTLARARQRSEQEWVGFALATYAELAERTGDRHDALLRALEAAELTDDLGSGMVKIVALHAVGLAHLLDGNTAEAEAALDEALGVIRQHNSGRFEEAPILAHRASAHMLAGQTEAAWTAADAAVDVARRQGAHVLEGLALLTRARLGRITERSRERTLLDLDAAKDVMRQTGAISYEPFIKEELGRVHQDEPLLLDALRLYRQIGATGHARRLENELSARAHP